MPDCPISLLDEAIAQLRTRATGQSRERDRSDRFKVPPKASLHEIEHEEERQFQGDRACNNGASPPAADRREQMAPISPTAWSSIPVRFLYNCLPADPNLTLQLTLRILLKHRVHQGHQRQIQARSSARCSGK